MLFLISVGHHTPDRARFLIPHQTIDIILMISSMILTCWFLSITEMGDEGIVAPALEPGSRRDPTRENCRLSGYSCYPVSTGLSLFIASVTMGTPTTLRGLEVTIGQCLAIDL